MRTFAALAFLLLAILTTGCFANCRALKGSEVTRVESGLGGAPGPTVSPSRVGGGDSGTTGDASGAGGYAEGPSGVAGRDGPNPVNGELGRWCKSDSKNFKGPCFSDHNCESVCLTEGFQGGECAFPPHCECNKPC